MDSKHPTWDKEKLIRRGKNFDQKVYDERRKYLMSIPEDASFSLPMEDWYDRIRFLREILAMEHIKSNGGRYDSASEKVEPKASTGLRKATNFFNLGKRGYKEVD